MTNEYIIREEAMSLPVLPREQRIQLRSIDESFEEGWRQALENLAILPAADVVPVRHGTWIKADEQPYFRKHYHAKVCSECGKRKDGKGLYCPNCGAKMDGGQHE